MGDRHSLEYVRFYKEQDALWHALSWDARSVYAAILVASDRRGQIPVRRSGERGLAALLRCPLEVLVAGVRELRDDGRIVIEDGVVSIVGYVHEQAHHNAPSERQRRMRDKDRGPCRVYFIGTDDMSEVKIGSSSTPAARLTSLQTGSSKRLSILATIPGTQVEERALHKRFARLRSHGEWFFCTGELAAYIDTLRAESVDAKGGQS